MPYVTFGGETGYDYNQGIISGYRGGLKTMDKHADAHIRIEDIKGAVMLVCGELDTLWPSCDMARQLEARAKDKGAPAPVLLAYDRAGHAGFGVPAKDPKGLGELGGTDADNQAARQDAWPKAVEFLKTNLAAADPAPQPVLP